MHTPPQFLFDGLQLCPHAVCNIIRNIHCVKELFRRLNLAPGGTALLVRMREQLIDVLDHREDLG
jgi:hypothetical protein